jgi:hypothetical protein
MAAAKNKPWKNSASSDHLTNLKQSILETLNIYGLRQCLAESATWPTVEQGDQIGQYFAKWATLGTS